MSLVGDKAWPSDPHMPVDCWIEHEQPILAPRSDYSLLIWLLSHQKRRGSMMSNPHGRKPHPKPPLKLICYATADILLTSLKHQS